MKNHSKKIKAFVITDEFHSFHSLGFWIRFNALNYGQYITNLTVYSPITANKKGIAGMLTQKFVNDKKLTIYDEHAHKRWLCRVASQKH